MKVALMGRSLRGPVNGVSRYTGDLVRALAPILGDCLTVFLTRAPDGLEGVPGRRERASFPTPNEYARAFWEQTIVPSRVARIKADLYHSPNYILPLALRCPTVVTIHDLAFLDARLHRLRSHLYLSTLTTLALRKATRIICVSESTRDRLLERFPGTAERVRVVGEGINPMFTPQAAAAVADFRRRIGVEEPYVLAVGTVEPRKNLPRLVRAFERAVELGGHRHHLVIAGAIGWKQGPSLAAVQSSPLRSRIHLLGYLPDEDLPPAYAGADVFAYPSLQEGYGLPPLEAMACGTPVLTSNVSAMPEVVGSAALTVDPLDVEAMATAMAGLLDDEAARSDLARRGLERARGFGWGAVAEQVLAVYREALQ